jgi:hypothetical protein
MLKILIIKIKILIVIKVKNEKLVKINTFCKMSDNNLIMSQLGVIVAKLTNLEERFVNVERKVDILFEKDESVLSNKKTSVETENVLSNESTTLSDKKKVSILDLEDDKEIAYSAALINKYYFKKGVKRSENTLADMVDCLSLGDVVVLTIGNSIATVHHKCDCSIKDDKFLSTRRVIFLDVQDNPGLADKDDGWDYYFCGSGGARSCTCNVRSILRSFFNKKEEHAISNKNEESVIPYAYYYSLAFRIPVVIFDKEHKGQQVLKQNAF